MRPGSSIRLLCLCLAIYLSNPGSASAQSPPKLEPGQLLLDLTSAPWQFHVPEAGAKADYAAVASASSWQSIFVGKRWERLGHPELSGKTVWLRLAFDVPAELEGNKLGFFATAADDEARLYLNGTAVGGARYTWGAIVPGPIDVDLTPQIRFGQTNLLMIQITDTNPIRAGGLLGNVLLYRTLPFSRTERGSIAANGKTSEELSVVLHLGDALLARGEKTRFSADELRELEIPPSILRDDELVLLVPSPLVSQPDQLHRLQLENVCPMTDSRPLAIACEQIPATVGLYERMEILPQVAGTYTNPFDPRQIDVAAIVTTPSGKLERISAFFGQDFTPVDVAEEEEILLPKKGSPWKLYYRPRETGKHTIELLAQDRSGIRRVAPKEFEVTPTSERGFLRVSKRDPRYFDFDNGQSFFGIGPSGWIREANYFFGGNPRWLTTRRMDSYYERKAASQSTFEYFLSCFFGQLYLPGGYIDQHVAWKTEHRVRTLERLGIYWIVVYDDVHRASYYGFDTMPYSAAQGGPCQKVEEVYFNPQALQMQKNQLRYWMSRVSDSPAIWIWNCGDEGQPGNRFSPTLVRWWLQELHRYIREMDIYEHPHIIGEDALPVGSDAVIIHDWYAHDPPRAGGKGIYSCDKDDNFKDAVGLTVCELGKWADARCPVIIPEGGCCEWKNSYHLSGEHWDFPEAISFHQNLWTSLFLKSAAGGTEWLANVMDREKQFFHATAMHQYLEGESLTEARWEIATLAVSNENLRAFALQSEGKTLAWVQNKNYTWYDAGQRKQSIPAVADAQLVVPVSRDGAYRIELWDTRSGQIVSTTQAQSTSGKVGCELPPIDKDVALKVVFQATAAKGTSP